MGHAAGGAVLAAFGVRLTAWAGPRAAVDRLGGDEFAVVLHLNTAHRQLRLEQLVQTLHNPVTLDDGRTVHAAASVSAATPDLIGTRDLGRLQRAADAALYAGKHTGRAVLATAAQAAAFAVRQRAPGRTPGNRDVGTSSMTALPLPEGDWIRGISIRQPWTTAILTGAKTIENRPQPTLMNSSVGGRGV
ncbi:diguanylate cyclase domain-containing protein [Streptomyces sp. NPDC059171]|uniref:diguanylate cyclase domain-containing protein n=1 Tax=Streptomyces sp. NPDC059171 TaxID=3346755 RepID=UPI0036858766